MGEEHPELKMMDIFIRLGSPDHIDGEAFVTTAWQRLDSVESSRFASRLDWAPVRTV